MNKECAKKESDSNEEETKDSASLPSEKCSKFRMQQNEVIEKMTTDNMLTYIKSLHEHIKKQAKKIKKYKEKLKKKKKADSRSSSSEPKENYQPLNKPIVPLSFIDEIKQAAEVAQNQTDFVYEPESGLFYDRKTGYYYDAERGLYYDGNSGCYYTYNQDENKFEFHSQVYREAQLDKQHDDSQRTQKCIEVLSSSSSSDGENYRRRGRSRRKRRRHHRNAKPKRSRSEPEDGEIDSSGDEEEVIEVNDNGFEDIAKKYPPSLRIIVTETIVPKLKVGELFLITFKGGTLGREGDHDVIIPDINVSKYHLKFTYDEKAAQYNCVDLGSRNGTILNGARMCSSQQESTKFNIPHGSVIELSQTKLLCHIHDGHTTCGHCEPGLVVAPDSVERQPVLTHREGLKQLQKRYGLENEKYIDPKSPNSKDYNDRAATRRVKVGGFNGTEKTEKASLETAIPTQNKGFKMLSNMGWSKGQKLGKNDEGLLEPIELKSADGKQGLGSTSVAIPVDRNSEKKKLLWKKAQERYNAVPKVDIFDEKDDDY